MDAVSSAIVQILSDPKVQAVIMGFVVKIAVDWLKKEFVVLDEQGTKQYKVPVQILVAVCSMAATLGQLYLTGGLHTFDPQQLVTLITVTLPVYLSAMGVHLVHQDIKAKLGKPKNV